MLNFGVMIGDGLPPAQVAVDDTGVIRIVASPRSNRVRQVQAVLWGLRGLAKEREYRVLAVGPGGPFIAGYWRWNGTTLTTVNALRSTGTPFLRGTKWEQAYGASYPYRLEPA